MKAPLARWSGLLPLLLFAWISVDYTWRGYPWELLWACNYCQVVLGAGILAEMPLLVWIPTLWLIAGSPLWIMDVALFGDFRITAVLTHIGGSALGLWLIVGYLRCFKLRRYWLYAALFMALTQLVSRWISPPAMNINMSFKVYPPLRTIFPVYWIYWCCNFVFSMGVLFCLEKVILRIFLVRNGVADLNKDGVARGIKSSESNNEIDNH